MTDRVTHLEESLAATERLAALLIKFIVAQCADGRLSDSALRSALLVHQREMNGNGAAAHAPELRDALSEIFHILASETPR